VLRLGHLPDLTIESVFGLTFVLALVVLSALLLPTRRAVRLDLARALRTE
jgi:ABC-type antimicrobial peptide transport system permease subunit